LVNIDFKNNYCKTVSTKKAYNKLANKRIQNIPGISPVISQKWTISHTPQKNNTFVYKSKGGDIMKISVELFF